MTIARYVVIFDREIGLQDGQARGLHDGTGPDAVRHFAEDLGAALELDGEFLGINLFAVLQRIIITDENEEALLRAAMYRPYQDDPLSLPRVPRSGEGEQVDPWQQ